MLINLAIQDYAVVDHLEIDLHAGMTCITGETGAGKSILLDSLSLALGARGAAARSAAARGTHAHGRTRRARVRGLRPGWRPPPGNPAGSTEGWP